MHHRNGGKESIPLHDLRFINVILFTTGRRRHEPIVWRPRENAADRDRNAVDRDRDQRSHRGPSPLRVRGIKLGLDSLFPCGVPHGRFGSPCSSYTKRLCAHLPPHAAAAAAKAGIPPEARVRQRWSVKRRRCFLFPYTAQGQACYVGLLDRISACVPHWGGFLTRFIAKRGVEDQFEREIICQNTESRNTDLACLPCRNPLFAELRKAGQSLLGVEQQQLQKRQQQQQQQQKQRSPSEDGDMEAGEIPEGADDDDDDENDGRGRTAVAGSGSGHKRRLSPSGSDEDSQQRRATGGPRRTPPMRSAPPQSILDRVIEDVQSMKQMQYEMDVDPDAPAAYKSSPSVSGV